MENLHLILKIETFIFIALLFFFVRYLISKRYGKDIGAKDHIAYHNLITYYRKNNHFIPKTFDNYLFPENTYPMFIPWLLSFLPQRIVEGKVDKYFTHFIDFINLIVLYFFTIYLFDNIWITFLSCLLYVITPTFLNDIARTFYLSSRAFGSFLVSIFMIDMYFVVVSGNLIFWIIGFIIFSLVPLTQRFSTQVIVFFTIGLSIAYSFSFLLIFIVGFPLATIFSFGFYLKLFDAHIGGFRFFIKLDNKHNLVKGKSDIRKLLSFVLNPVKNREIFNSYMAQGIYSTPILIVIPLGLFYYSSIVDSQVFLFLFLWSIYGILAFIITSFRSIRFLGQNFRYIEYIILPLTIMMAYIFWNHMNVITVVAMLITISWSLFINIKYYYRIVKLIRTDTKFEKAKENLFKFIKDKKQSNLLIIPYNLSHEIVKRTNHKCLFYLGTISNSRVDEFLDITKFYPFPDVPQSIEKFNIEYIIINYKDAQISKEKTFFNNNIENNIIQHKEIYSNIYFKVYKV